MNLTSKIESLDYKLVLRRFVLLLLSARLFMHLLYSPENWTQIFKDIEYYKAFILLLVIIAIYRGIKITDWKAWGYLLLAAGVGIVYFKIKGFTQVNCGEDYYLYLILRAVMQLLFVGLMLDLVRHRPYRWDIYLKNLVVILYVLFSIIFIVSDYSMVVPLICPVAAVFLTRFDKTARKEFIFILGGGIYLAFFKCFTQSLIQQPNNFWGTRYLGVFLSPTTIGFSSGCALISGIFFALYFKQLGNKKLFFTSIILSLYPLVAVVMCNSRNVYLGIIMMGLGLFLFMYSKNLKTLLKRAGISIGILLLGLLLIFGFSKFLNFAIDQGMVSEKTLTHSLNSIRLMTGGSVDNDISSAQGDIFVCYGQVGQWKNRSLA